MDFCHETNLQWIEGEVPDQSFIMPTTFMATLHAEAPAMIQRDTEFERLRMAEFHKHSEAINTRLQQSSQSEQDNRTQALMNVVGLNSIEPSSSSWPSPQQPSDPTMPINDDKHNQEIDAIIAQLQNAKSCPGQERSQVIQQVQNKLNLLTVNSD